MYNKWIKTKYGQCIFSRENFQHEKWYAIYDKYRIVRSHDTQIRHIISNASHMNRSLLHFNGFWMNNVTTQSSTRYCLQSNSKIHWELGLDFKLILDTKFTYSKCFPDIICFPSFQMNFFCFLFFFPSEKCNFNRNFNKSQRVLCSQWVNRS